MPRRTTPVPAQSADRRADAQIRTVSLTRDVVRIDRKVHGMTMRVAVPVHAYQGVALVLRPDEEGALFYRLHLIHADQDLSVTLDEARDDSEILADWRLWSRFLRLPALVERRAGMIEQADLSLGEVVLGGAPSIRRLPGIPAGRRPRFLRRRKIGVAPAQPVMHGDEREIIART